MESSESHTKDYGKLTKMQTICEIIHILRRKENIGDAAVLKLSLTGREEGSNPYRDQAKALKHLCFAPIRLEELRKMPKASFGWAYYDFMQRNRLQPLNFSPRVQKLFDRFPVSARYARVHDMIHTLLGFEPDLAGELAVYAFADKQQYSLVLTRAYWTARVAARLLKPWAWADLKTAERRGLALADRASILVVERLEDYLPRPLSEVRQGLVPAHGQLTRG